MIAAVDCQDLRNIADFLGFAPQHIFFLVKKSDDLYTEIAIPRRSDATRHRMIHIPYSELKGVQRAILDKILTSIPVNEHAYAYVRRRSVVDAAFKLCGKKSMLKIDIQDFFPTISYRRVYGLFRRMGFSDKVAFILARLSMRRNAICQGAPTSPCISNLILRRLDHQFACASRSWDLSYLRYSDDLFFYRATNFNHLEFRRLAGSIILENGFRGNERKTHYFPSGSPRKTLGLLTHGSRPQIPGPRRRIIRAVFFNASRNIHWAQDNMNYLRGILEWHKCVYGKDEKYRQFKSIFDSLKSIRVHETDQSA